MPPNHARGCVKTPRVAFWRTKKGFESPSAKIKMRQNKNVSVAFSTSRVVEEFSHSLALQRTRTSHHCCNRGVPWAGSLSLGR